MKKSLLFISACAVYSGVWGSGFQVLEQGASNIGTATAGATVNANQDASAAFWNPSAVAFADYQTKIDTALNVIVPDFTFKNKNTNVGGNPVYGNSGGNGGKVALVPNLYVAHKLDEDWALTLSVSSPFGLGTNYEDGWVGRYHAMESQLMTLDFNPSVVYKATDWLSFSVGASAQMVDATLSQVNPANNAFIKMTADGWSGGANAGVTVKYYDQGYIGFSYRSQVSHSVSGEMKMNGTKVTDIEADVTLPNVYTIGMYQRFWGWAEDIALMADYSFTQWSSFDKLDIKYANGGGIISHTPENWKNTSRVALGMHYYVSKDWTLRLGTAWDESPVPSAEFRTARIPDSDRIWFSTGVGYKYKGINIDFAYTYIMFNDVFINNASYNPNGTPQPNVINGDFGGCAHVISLQLGFKW